MKKETISSFRWHNQDLEQEEVAALQWLQRQEAPKPKYPSSSRRSSSILSTVGRDSSILSVMRMGGMALGQEEY